MPDQLKKDGRSSGNRPIRGTSAGRPAHAVAPASTAAATVPSGGGLPGASAAKAHGAAGKRPASQGTTRTRTHRSATRAASRLRGSTAVGATQMLDRKAGLVVLSAAFDAMTEQVYVLDVLSQRYVYSNRAAQLLSGYTPEEIAEVGPAHFLDQSEDEVRLFCAEVQSAGLDGLRNEAAARTRYGQSTVVEAQHAAFDLAGRRMIVSVVRDIWTRKKKEASNRRLRNMYAALSSTNEAILHARSARDLYQQVCMAASSGGFVGAAVFLPRAQTEQGYIAAFSGGVEGALDDLEVTFAEGRAGSDGTVAQAYLCGMPVFLQDAVLEAHSADERVRLQRLGMKSFAALPIRQGDRCVGVLAIGSAESHAFDTEVKSLLSRMTANIAFGLGNIAAQEERLIAEQRANHLATHDALTGLPNRGLFSELLTQALHTARRQQTRLAVMFVDLDRFKVINDSLGHAAGDTLLRQMGQRLRRTLRASDVVARIGGDEFVVLLPCIKQRAEAAAVARKVLAAVLEPIDLDGHDCRVSASIGVCVFPDAAQDEQALMSNADAAMYRAKQNGKNNAQFFSTASRQTTTHQLMLETQLRGALARGEFTLVYQVKQDLASGTVTGVEALLRWQNPKLGAVLPGEFLPIAEETGLTEEIGRWVLHTACAQNVAWQRAGLRHVCMAVNLSASQFAGRTLVRDIDEALRVTGMDPKLLELEITETMVVLNPLRARELLTAIKSRGIRLAIDDFGTGYSSLGQLRNFPIDTIKVDRSFIAEPATDAEDRAITQAIIAMGRTLSMNVVAEGVETPEQVAFLRANACSEVQGFYFGRPMLPELMVDRLR